MQMLLFSNIILCLSKRAKNNCTSQKERAQEFLLHQAALVMDWDTPRIYGFDRVIAKRKYQLPASQDSALLKTAGPIIAQTCVLPAYFLLCS
jgi:hypothetical protein